MYICLCIRSSNSQEIEMILGIKGVLRVQQLFLRGCWLKIMIVNWFCYRIIPASLFREFYNRGIDRKAIKIGICNHDHHHNSLPPGRKWGLS